MRCKHSQSKNTEIIYTEFPSATYYLCSDCMRLTAKKEEVK
ncbi:MAG: hypothetical protein AMQ22_00003 [Candidatus Methanofastidiosum methylothiophilum]|uniref:Uncharacterized protein n=1 Tax=Candidatus Methanofastidiosum methylothiophilum TaxID=1705564 RepID=A0A150JA38_9EURY|nr:MAG: hypothetical protein AMQ22_00003 [Candidatus Methanofastidiosum methylthiophilus]